MDEEYPPGYFARYEIKQRHEQRREEEKRKQKREMKEAGLRKNEFGK